MVKLILIWVIDATNIDCKAMKIVDEGLIAGSQNLQTFVRKIFQEDAPQNLITMKSTRMGQNVELCHV